MSEKITNKDILKSAEILKNYCKSFGSSCKGCVISESSSDCSNFYDLNTDSLKSYIEELDTNEENTEEHKTEILNDDIDTINEQSKTYEDGLEDMYKCIQKLYIGISIDDLIKIFNLKRESFNSVGGVLNHIFKNFNSNEIIEKVKVWEKSQIQVGDEVISTISNAKGVITYTYDYDKRICILWDDGSCEETIEIDDLKRTGRNLKRELDNIKNVLTNKNILTNKGESKV